MMGWWIAQGEPILPSMDPTQNIAYISDIGATFLKPLFIAGSATMVVVFDLAFISERWLRHNARLTPNYSKREAFLSVCAILAAIVGAAGLILLTIFDTRHYPRAHNALLAVFMYVHAFLGYFSLADQSCSLGYVVSAIFICAEYQRLGIHYREHRILRISFWIKLFFILLEVALAIVFGVTQAYGKWNVAAVVEWIVSLIYIIFVLSFIIDFLPATHTRSPENRFPRVRRGDDVEAQKTQQQGNLTGGPVYSNGGHSVGTSSYGSQQPMAESGRYHQPARNF